MKAKKNDGASNADAAAQRDVSAANESSTFAATDEAMASKAESNPTATDESVELATELAAEKDRVLRLHAELENVRSRAARELAEERKYAAIPMSRDLLPVVDNVDRAIEAAEKRGDAGDLLEGFRLVRQQLISVLEQHKCQLIEAEGEPFDPQLHEAILQQPSSEAPAGHVTAVTQQGYKLNDRIVRPAQVIVSSGDPSQE